MKKLFILACVMLVMAAGSANAQKAKRTATIHTKLASSSIDSAADAAAVARMRHKMDSIRRYRPTVALVLAGGGAKGAAHIGAFKLIEEMGIPVDMVLGTSMGGLVGGLIAMGYPAHTIDSIMSNTNWATMLSDKVPIGKMSFQRRKYNDTYSLRIPFYYKDKEWEERARAEYNSRIAQEEANGLHSSEVVKQYTANLVSNLPDGFLYGYNVNNVINSLTVGYQDSMDFCNLPIPYCCVATDLVAMRAKYWTSGRLSDAMRSTMSIPFYFTPVRTDGHILIDGGTRNNFPTDMARAMGADYIIGVDLSQPRSYSDINGLTPLLLQCINLMGKDAFDNNLPLADVYIHPDMTGLNMMSFDSASIADCLNRGYEAAQLNRKALEQIKAKTGSTHPQRIKKPRGINTNTQPVLISSILYEGIDSNTAIYFRTKCQLQPGNAYTSQQIEDEMALMYGTGYFDQVSYNLLGRAEPFTLVFHCKRGPVHQFGASLHFDSKTILSAAINIGLNKRELSGFKADISGIIGNNPAATLDLQYTTLRGPSFGLSFHSRYQSLEHYSAQQALINHVTITQTIWYNKVDLYAITHSWRNSSIRVGALYEVQPYLKTVTLSETDLPVYDTSYSPDSKSDNSSYQDGYSSINSKGWDEFSISPYIDLIYDNTDDSFFPTKGLSLGLRYNYLIHINNSTSDYAEPQNHITDNYWHLILGQLSGVIPVNRRLSILPSLHFNFSIQPDLPYRGEASLPVWYETSIGGITPSRFYYNQLPYIGYNLPHFIIYSNSNMVANLDFRYQLTAKAYISLTAATYSNCASYDQPEAYDIYKSYRYNTFTDYAFALKLGYKTLLGPLAFNVHWSRYNEPSHWGVYFSIGNEF